MGDKKSNEASCQCPLSCRCDQLTSGTLIGAPVASSRQAMPVLEARFHPKKRDGRPMIVVGRVHCDGASARVEPATGLQDDPQTAAEAPAMLEKLRYIVAANGPKPFKHLLTLASDFWSFVEV